MPVDPHAPHPLAAPQTARAAIRFGDRFVMESEARATPLGLLAVGGLVGAILLAVVPIVRAKRGGKSLRRPADLTAPNGPPGARNAPANVSASRSG